VAYLLDTNVCVIYLNGKSPLLQQRFNSTPVAEILVCAVAKGELFYGSRRSNNPTKSLQIQQQFLAQFASLPFDDAAAVVYGEIRAALAQAGTPIGPNDLTLVTHNTREFSRVQGLKLADWEI
jgi:tRNA(fMet)-specific endonuclease VapC